jgi:murein DD-endopeptidase MepM/ murein hydrolase activator NlpD
MPWWQKPFTLILVPHDGSDTVSVTVKGLTVCLISLLLSVAVGIGSFFTLSAFTHDTSQELRSKVKQKLAKLQKQNRRYRRLSKSVSTLQKKLRKTEKLHLSILKLNGLNELAYSSEKKLNSISITNVDNTASKIEKTHKSIRRQIKRNQKLKTIKRFVKNRNEVLEKTPVLWPVDGWLSSSYGMRQDPMGGKGRSFHEGVDLAAWHQSPVRAPADGTVVFSGRKGGYGQTVRIRHEYGYTTLFGHLSERLVEEGDPVTKGRLIGRVGSTGHSTGSHLHYEVRINGKAVNPWPYLVQEYDSFQSVIDQEAISDAGN